MHRAVQIAAEFAILLVTLTLAQSAHSQATPAWLPIKKSEFVKLYAEKMNLPRTEAKSLDVWLAEKRLESPASSRELSWAEKQFANSEKFLTHGETFWLPSRGYKGNVVFVLAGRGARIHSFRVQANLVNMSDAEQQRTWQFLSALYEKLFPDWLEARQWPRRSLEAAWNTIARGMQRPRNLRPNESFIRTFRNGITSSTFGVPPDFVIYSVTVRQSCVPTIALGEPLTRQIC